MNGNMVSPEEDLMNEMEEAPLPMPPDEMMPEVSAPPQPAELVNLAEQMDEKELREIASICVKEFNDDLDSRQEWEEMHARWLEIYYQNDTPETPPWDNSSEEALPVLAEAVNQFQSRSYKAFFPPRS